MDFFLKVSRMAEKLKIPKRHLLKLYNYVRAARALNFLVQFTNTNLKAARTKLYSFKRWRFGIFNFPAIQDTLKKK